MDTAKQASSAWRAIYKPSGQCPRPEPGQPAQRYLERNNLSAAAGVPGFEPGSVAVCHRAHRGICRVGGEPRKLASGYLSDRFGSRKLPVFLGYSLAAITRPFLAFVTSWPQVLVVRMTDRIGKGIRGAPRDALIATVFLKTSVASCSDSTGRPTIWERFSALSRRLSCYRYLQSTPRTRPSRISAGISFRLRTGSSRFTRHRVLCTRECTSTLCPRPPVQILAFWF